MRIRHRHTSTGDSGQWWIKDKKGTATGWWKTGAWSITENTTGMNDGTIHAILDDVEFWPGIPADGEWYTSEWDGATLTNK